MTKTHLQLPLIAIGVVKKNQTEIFEIATLGLMYVFGIGLMYVRVCDGEWASVSEGE